MAQFLSCVIEITGRHTSFHIKETILVGFLAKKISINELVQCIPAIYCKSHRIIGKIVV